METTQGSLTILNAHTPTPAVFWNGVEVPNVTGINVCKGKVTIEVEEIGTLAEMKAAGIAIRRTL